MRLTLATITALQIASLTIIGTGCSDQGAPPAGDVRPGGDLGPALDKGPPSEKGLPSEKGPLPDKGPPSEKGVTPDAAPVVIPIVADILNAGFKINGDPYTSPTPALTQGTTPVTWSLVAGPTEAEIDPATGVVTWLDPTVGTHTITIRATNEAGSDDESWVVTVTVALLLPVAKPVFTPPGGSYTTASIQVTISCTTTGATIRYTLDGTLPTTTSTVYTAPITLTGTRIVFAKAYLAGRTPSQPVGTIFTHTAWSKVNVALAPLARSGHTMVYDPTRARVVLFGGLGTAVLTDTWEWDGSKWTQRATGGPTANIYHRAMAYAGGGKILLFGGSDATTGANGDETWTWTGTAWALHAPATRPPKRSFTAMAYDAIRKRVVLFGGDGGYKNLLNDTWEWDGVSWLQRKVAGPAPRANHGMAYDSVRGRVVLYGGVTSVLPATYSPETWEWDGNAWLLRSTSGPPQYERVTLAYDSLRKRTIYYPDDGSNHTWQWNGYQWAAWPAIPMPTPARYHTAMAFDAARGLVVLFGGRQVNTSTKLADTWVF